MTSYPSDTTEDYSTSKIQTKNTITTTEGLVSCFQPAIVNAACCNGGGTNRRKSNQANKRLRFFLRLF